ncbi:MAG TPA: type II secretion system protein [Myxococcota bacterium]|nr:type II secretion system protein [Myxococcota bacterium]
MRRRVPAGFTVLELLAVIAIAIMMSVAGAVTIRSVRRADASTAAARLATAIRYTYDTAVLNNGTYRLILDFDSSSWWVERVQISQNCGGIAILPGEDDEEEDPDDEKDKEEKEAVVNQWAASNPFDGGSMAARIWEMGGVAGADDEAAKEPSLEDLTEEEIVDLKRRRARVRDDLLKKTALPNGITFKRVMTSHQDEPTEEGTAEIYFFPSGYVEKALVFIERGEDVYTIETVPLKGIGVIHKEELDYESLMAAN